MTFGAAIGAVGNLAALGIVSHVALQTTKNIKRVTPKTKGSFKKSFTGKRRGKGSSFKSSY